MSAPRFHFPFSSFRPPPKLISQLTRTSVTTLKLLCAVHLVTTTLVELRLCSGLSMLPTLSPHGDFVLLSPLSLLLGNLPKRGDVVVATSPMDPRRTVCKRVLALEGDIIQVDPRGKERRTWKALADIETPSEPQTEPAVGVELRDRDSEGRPLVSGGQRGAGQFVKIPKGHVWLQGDNLSNSTDSRAYGPVPIALLKGTVLARVGGGRFTIDVRYIQTSHGSSTPSEHWTRVCLNIHSISRMHCSINDGCMKLSPFFGCSKDLEQGFLSRTRALRSHVRHVLPSRGLGKTEV